MVRLRKASPKAGFDGRPRTLLAILAANLLTTSLLATTAARAESVRLAAAAFGVTAEVEVRDLPRQEADAAAREALKVIFEISRLTAPDGQTEGGLGALNTAAGQGPLALDEEIADLLVRGLQVCIWSRGAQGPLGGELYRLWTAPDPTAPGVRESGGIRAGLPKPSELRRAVASAACDLLGLAGGDAPTGELAEGSRIDASWMARGFAIDQGARRLEELGVTNAWLEIGSVARGMGPGPDGHGWFVELPSAPGSREPIEQLWLQNQALAIAGPVTLVEHAPAPLINQRTGVPARGVVAVVVVAEEAWDAEALSAALFILGQREGQLRLGGYSPRPSILWLLGEGDGPPLESSYRWSELRLLPRR